MKPPYIILVRAIGTFSRRLSGCGVRVSAGIQTAYFRCETLEVSGVLMWLIGVLIFMV